MNRTYCREASMYRYHVLALLLYPLICLPLLATLSTANPIVQPPSPLFQISQSPSLQNTRNPRRPGRTDLPLSGVKPDLLEKRVPPVPLFNDPHPARLNLFHFQKIGLLTPVVSAAKAMEGFYHSVAAKAAGEWQATPTLAQVIIQEGKLQLSFLCTGDTIPWNFVKNTAMRLYEAATLGFTDLFEAIYMDEAGTVVVSVAVKITDALSSSGGSTSDYREGSVPSVSFP